MKTMGHPDLPPEQQKVLRGAIRWEIGFTIGYTVVTIGVIALVVGEVSSDEDRLDRGHALPASRRSPSWSR